MSIKCLECSLIKSKEKFYTKTQCKDCRKVYMKKYKQENKEKIKKSGKEYYEKNKIIVRKKQSNYRLENRESINEYKRKYYLENSEKICKSTNKYKQENKDKIIVSNKLYRELNSEKINIRRRILRQKYSTDPRFKIMHNTQSRIRFYLKTNGTTKNIKTEELIGCSAQFLKNWLEYQFDSNMSWDNYGVYWDIDHVKPCKSFNPLNSIELKECFNWKNVRPLKSEKNISKSNKIIPNALISQMVKIYYYIKALNTTQC